MASSASPSNTAAWALRAKSRPFVVSSAPYRAPPPGHVAIKVHCVAINPIDWIMQDQDIFGAHYPAIFGSDLAGEVVQTGEGVVGLFVGQKVIAYVLTSSSSMNNLTNTTNPVTPTASQPTTPPTALSNNTSSRPQSPSLQFPPPSPSKAPSSSPSQSPPRPQASTNATTSPSPTLPPPPLPLL